MAIKEQSCGEQTLINIGKAVSKEETLCVAINNNPMALESTILQWLDGLLVLSVDVCLFD